MQPNTGVECPQLAMGGLGEYGGGAGDTFWPKITQYKKLTKLFLKYQNTNQILKHNNQVPPFQDLGVGVRKPGAVYFSRDSDDDDDARLSSSPRF